VPAVLFNESTNRPPNRAFFSCHCPPTFARLAALALLLGSGERLRRTQGKELNDMRRNEGLLDKRVSVRGLGAVIGGTLLASLVAGLIRHRRALKRLIEINRM
jgi:hypothetical protein